MECQWKKGWTILNLVVKESDIWAEKWRRRLRETRGWNKNTDEKVMVWVTVAAAVFLRAAEGQWGLLMGWMWASEREKYLGPGTGEVEAAADWYGCLWSSRTGERRGSELSLEDITVWVPIWHLSGMTGEWLDIWFWSSKERSWLESKICHVYQHINGIQTYETRYTHNGVNR